ncbi:MAG: hypothetical protein LBM71_00050 [Elusimicrobiota bacterium]|jgi:tetratricopeptide (TPR) repeat protein|nr:hypothetical protein [Elusimicrobiota bacterium]
MKNLAPLILFFSLLFALPPKAVAQQPKTADAQSSYDNGSYITAAELYENQIAAGDTSNPYLYYNLANSYFKAGDPDKAIINYYRAFKLLPRDKDIRGNLAFALADTGQRLTPEGVPATAFNLYHFFSLGELKGLMWAGLWLFAFALMFFVLSDRKVLGKKLLIIAAILTVFFGGWHLLRLPSESKRLAVVVAPRAEVRSGPGDSFVVSLNVPRAHLVSIIDSKGDWAQVEVNSQAQGSGWVLKNTIEEI